MTNESRAKDQGEVFCRRLQRELPVSEHTDCPYCFGKRDQVKDGEHSEFCGYQEGKDPINFGFPTDSSRNTRS